jgi:hypothetical protein
MLDRKANRFGFDWIRRVSKEADRHLSPPNAAHLIVRLLEGSFNLVDVQEKRAQQGCQVDLVHA